jgi:multidrug efflux pump subunit AcrB
MNLPKFALDKKPVVLIATLLLVALGVFTFQTAPRKEDPQFTIRDGFIVTPWLGATASEVEQLVTDPIELALAGIKTIRKIDSTSYIGASFIQVTTIDAVSDADAVWDKVRRELKLIEPSLPPGCGTPMLNDHISQAAVMILCLYQDPSTLSKYRYTPRELSRNTGRKRPHDPGSHLAFVRGASRQLRRTGRGDLRRDRHRQVEPARGHE